MGKCVPETIVMMPFAQLALCLAGIAASETCHTSECAASAAPEQGHSMLQKDQRVDKLSSGGAQRSQQIEDETGPSGGKYVLKSAWTEGQASNCTNLGCTTLTADDAGLAMCKAKCDSVASCNLINFVPPGADGSSGEGRCCRRDCDNLQEMKLTSHWKGWDVYIREGGKRSSRADAADTIQTCMDWAETGGTCTNIPDFKWCNDSGHDQQGPECIDVIQCLGKCEIKCCAQSKSSASANLLTMAAPQACNPKQADRACDGDRSCVVQADGHWAQCINCDLKVFQEECSFWGDQLRDASEKFCHLKCAPASSKASSKCKNDCTGDRSCVVQRDGHWAQCIDCTPKVFQKECTYWGDQLKRAAEKFCDLTC